MGPPTSQKVLKFTAPAHTAVQQRSFPRCPTLHPSFVPDADELLLTEEGKKRKKVRVVVCISKKMENEGVCEPPGACFRVSVWG